MNIFITGASGFVGGAAVTALKAQHQIYAMARSKKSSEKVRALGATPVDCDLVTIKPSHLSSCECVIHCAAYAEEWGKEADFFVANVTGTKNLLAAAKAAGVRRFILLVRKRCSFTVKICST